MIGAAYAVLVAGTTPFTWPADMAVATPLGLTLLAAVRWWPLHTAMIRPTDSTAHPYRPWFVLFLAILAWELYCYVAPGSRAQHPTLSSMTDAVDRYEALKALVVLVWLSLGWMIIRRGSAVQ